MGKINNGILGGFSGKVGVVVGSLWRDIDTMRAVAKPRTVPASPAEMLQQAKLALMSSFQNPMRELLDFGFRDFAKKKTGTNAAQSYNMKNALIVNEDGPGIVCEEVLVCRGDLPNVKLASARSTEKGLVHFEWQNNAGLGKANDADKAILVVLCHEMGSCAYTLEGGFRRNGQADLAVSGFSGCEVQTWLAFLSKDKKDIANSLFTGTFVVA